MLISIFQHTPAAPLLLVLQCLQGILFLFHSNILVVIIRRNDLKTWLAIMENRSPKLYWHSSVCWMELIFQWMNKIWMFQIKYIGPSQIQSSNLSEHKFHKIKVLSKINSKILYCLNYQDLCIHMIFSGGT